MNQPFNFLVWGSLWLAPISVNTLVVLNCDYNSDSIITLIIAHLLVFLLGSQQAVLQFAVERQQIYTMRCSMGVLEYNGTSQTVV